MMKSETKTTFIGLAVVVALGAGCASTLPQQRPADLSITMTRASGQAGPGQASGDTLVLANGQSNYKVDYEGGGAVSVPLDVDDKDLDALYALLVDVGFIELSNGYTVKDVGPGTWILVHWAGTDYIAHPDSQHSDERWMLGWQRIVGALKKLRTEQVTKKGIDIPPTFDTEIFGAGYQELETLE